MDNNYSKKIFCSKNIFFALGVFVSVIVAVLLSNMAKLPIIGWFIGGGLIGLSAQIFRVPKQNRNIYKVIFSIVLTGIVGAIAYYIGQNWL